MSDSAMSDHRRETTHNGERAAGAAMMDTPVGRAARPQREMAL